MPFLRRVKREVDCIWLTLIKWLMLEAGASFRMDNQNQEALSDTVDTLEKGDVSGSPERSCLTLSGTESLQITFTDRGKEQRWLH